MRRFWWLALTLVVVVVAVIADRVFPPDLSRVQKLSLAVQGRDGEMLDVLQSADGYWRLPATAKDVDPHFIRLLLATEDKRFWIDPGVDPLALLRAAGQLVAHGHVVSGGSTLTMQVARLLTPHRHDIAGKLQDIVRALQLQAHFSKQQILAMYLTLAPYGGNIEGIRAASLIYFQTPPNRLTDAEAALLVALPRRPEALRPGRHSQAAIAAARHVLVLAGLPANFPATDLPPLSRHPFPAYAPHLAERLRGEGYAGIVQTTLDSSLQIKIAALLKRELPWAAPQANIAALVVDNQSRAILAYLGGADYFAPHGMVDMVRARRSPGSALKPFFYGMAMDDGLILPDTLIEDAPVNVSGYAPQDFDRDFQGMVTVREALQQSYNLPAIQILRRVGPARFVAALRNDGATIALPGGAASLPVALGGLGINLQDLAMLYTGLADRGMAAQLRLLPDAPIGISVPEMTPQAAADIGSILRGSPLPPDIAADNAHAIGYKTGTSYGLRDAWAAGFSGDDTVVVWTGRIDGTPSPNAYGRISAAPLLYKIFSLLPADRQTPAVPAPVPEFASLAPNLRIFGATGAAAARTVPNRLRILFPPDGAILQVSGAQDNDSGIGLQASGGTPPYRWMVNGVPLPQPGIGLSMSWQPDGAGFAHIAVIDRNAQAASEDVQLR